MTDLSPLAAIADQLAALEATAADTLAADPTDALIATRARRVITAAFLARLALLWAQGSVETPEGRHAAMNRLRRALTRFILEAWGRWDGGDSAVLTKWGPAGLVGQWCRWTTGALTPCQVRRIGDALCWTYTPSGWDGSRRAAGCVDLSPLLHGDRAEAVALQEAMAACDAAARADGCDLG